jgi:Clp amino terminal domain, pathogenicity island component
MDEGVNELNLLQSIAAEEAHRLNCTWLGPDHFLLAILSPAFAGSPAAKALAQCSITRAAVERTIGAKQRVAGSKRRGLSWNPACHQMLGFSMGLASWHGAGEVTAEHVLMAQLYEPGFAGDLPARVAATSRSISTSRSESACVPSASGSTTRSRATTATTVAEQTA